MIKQEILQNQIESIYLKKYIDNLQVIPSGTISITLATGAALPMPVVDEPLDVNSVGTMSFELTDTNTANLGENLIAIFTYIYNGETFVQRVLFDVVISRLDIIIKDEDLYDDFVMLQELGYRIFGSVSEILSSSGQIKDENVEEVADYFKGGKLLILSGDNKDFETVVIQFDDTERVFYLQDSVPNTLVIDDKFLVIKSYETEINRAFEEIQEHIRLQGYRPSLIMDDTELKQVHIYGSILKILLGFGEKFEFQYNEYKEKYKAALDNLRLLYDTDETGLPGDADELTGQTSFVR